jgi:predicted amidophosphoribosyltransferase
VLPFTSCFAYLPDGTGSICEEGRLLCARLKSADSIWLPRLIARVWSEASALGRFGPSLGSRVVLVPVPGSAAAHGEHWVGERVASCLQQVGLGAQVWPVLHRRWPVRKSAFCAAGERPSVLEHYASFAVEPPPGSTTAAGLRLTLIDDVITRGRTLLAAACRLREAYPQAQIRAFVLLRTLARQEALLQLFDPCEGEVRFAQGDARRRP